MVVSFDKKDLVLETKGSLPTDVRAAVCRAAGMTSALSSFNFEGFTGFNTNYIAPLIQLMKSQITKKEATYYRMLEVCGDLRLDKHSIDAEFHIFRNLRDTIFLFKTLKSLGITLPDLRLGYHKEKDDEVTLFLDKKIIKVLNDLGDSSNDLVLYFYCLAKFLHAFYIVNPTLGTDTSGNIIFMESDLDALYLAYGSIPETIKVECIPLKEDVCFSGIAYVHSTYLPFTGPVTSPRYLSKYVYNVIKTSTSENLCIINTTLKEYYIIEGKTGVVYTNNELKEFNTFDPIEWIALLTFNISNFIPNKNLYAVNHVPLNSLLKSKSSEVIISNDASKFESLLEAYPYISENTNLKLYEGYFVGSTLKTEGGS